MGEVKNHANPKCHTPSLEPFRTKTKSLVTETSFQYCPSKLSVTK